MQKRRYILLCFMVCVAGLISGCATPEAANRQAFSCEDYTFLEVERMVSPYLNNAELDELRRNRNNMEHPSWDAAIHCLGYEHKLPDDVVATLRQIRSGC